MGLSWKFFSHSNVNQYQINLSLICPDINLDSENIYKLEGDGQLVFFDTRDILNFVEMEQFSSEEILEVRSKLGIYQVCIQLQKYSLGVN